MESLCIIPFYNEENRINKIQYNSIFTENKDIKFLLIDDGSIDSTLEILKCFQLEFDNVLVHQNKKNLGKAESIRSGFNTKNSLNYDFIGFFDSDLATPFYEYRLLLEKIKNSNLDFIFAARIQLYGYKIRRNQFRHFFSRIVVTVLNFIFNLNVYDTQCGCKIFRFSIIEPIFKKQFHTKWLFDVEIFIRYFNFAQFPNILEFPINEWNEVKGSKIKIIDFIKVPFSLIKLYYEYNIKKLF